MARLKKAPIVVLGSIVALVVTNCRMNGVAGDVQQVFAQGGNVRVDSATGKLSGNLVYKNVAVWQEMASETTEAVRAEQVTLTTPGTGWLLGATFGNNRVDTANRGFAFPNELAGSSGKGQFSGPPGLTELSIIAENVKLDRDAKAFFLPEWIGFESLSPFDALGCALNKSWRHEDISGVLGLPEGDVQITASIRNPEGNIAEVEARFTRTGVSNATYKARYDMPMGYDLYSLDFDQAKLVSATWTIEDQGFVKARNTACSGLIGLKEKRYHQIHITALRRELLASGLIPDPGIEEAYARFLAQGGKLEFSYKPAADYKQRLSAAADANARTQALGLSIKTSGAAVPLTFYALTPSEWNDDLRARTITNLIDQARALDDGTLALVDESTNSLIENLLLMESSTAVVDASELPFTEGETVALAGNEGEVASEILIQKIAFEELPKAVGQKVIITTTFGSKREGILKTAHNSGITVHTNLRGSMADVNIPKADIVSAEVHWDTVKTQ